MLEVYNVCHHRVKKSSIFVGPSVNEKPALSNVSTLESVFERMRFG